MRRITLAGETLSSHLFHSRPAGPEPCFYNHQNLLASGLTGHRQISSSTRSHIRQLDGPQPRRKRQPQRRNSFHAFTTTGRHSSANATRPEWIETERHQHAAVRPTWDSPEEEAEYANKFFQVLQDGQPDQVMTAMTDPRSAGLVGSLHQHIFLEALHRLSPTYFVEPFRNLHHPLHAWSILLNGVKRIEEVFDGFVKNLLTITTYRTSGGYPLDLAEFTHLLDCARSMGNGPLANDIWRSMKDGGVIPDGRCYNHYMEALVWDHCYTGQEAYRLRALPRSYYKRRQLADRNIGWQGYGTGQQSVRKTVMNLFREMLDNGHAADERSYINVMLASARVGHGPGIRHVLSTVWNIQVDILKQEPDNSKIPPPTPYEPWSALYPTENLLFAIAHGFGTNNDIPGAVRTIEFISASYNIPIPHRVWHELFERAYVQCRIRTTQTEDEQQANAVGPVSMQLVQSIFETMTSEPFNVQPTVQMRRFMINIGIDMGSLEDCKIHLDEAYNLLSETRQKEEKARALVLRCLVPLLETTQKQMRQGSPCDPSLFQSPILAEAIQSYDILRLEVYQQIYLLRRALWVTVRVPHWKDTPDKDWFYQERPKMLEEWCDFLPARKRIFYDENTGSVDMQGRTGFKDRHWCSDLHIPVRRMNDHQTLFHPIEHVAWTQDGKWNDLLNRYPWLDTTLAPLDRLFNFQRPNSPELLDMLEKLRGNWVEYPEEHPQSTASNPHGGFYGRLAALGLLKSNERGIFLLDDKSWI